MDPRLKEDKMFEQSFLVEKEWEDFWKNILVKDGKLNLTQLKKELFDYSTLLQEVPKVYDHITSGKISKPNTHASVVIAHADDNFREIADEDLLDLRGAIIEVLDGFIPVREEEE